MTLDKQLESIEGQVKAPRNFDSPPLQLWNPPFSGDIPIRISATGTWYHEEGEITRESLVRLFASILRREEDGEYYLVTPAEKWRIDVALHPLMVIDVEQSGADSEREISAKLNTGNF